LLLIIAIFMSHLLIESAWTLVSVLARGVVGFIGYSVVIWP
jgi:hypothetical protein